MARIFELGPEIYKNCGTEKSKGTKVFALAGKVRRSGLIEVPMGISIREIVFAIGGGIAGDRPFKAVQTGGPSGGCIPASLAETPVITNRWQRSARLWVPGACWSWIMRPAWLMWRVSF